MGMDVRTQEKEGLNVYALADGYVSRIGVSPYGYGNALYITYSNGFTSVYGHLQRFSPAVTAIVRKEQYAKEEFAVDISLTPYELPVQKGELVAYSGNTGASGGPHMHFEIRDALERTINPLDFGYQSADHIAPSIAAVKFYPMGGKKNTDEAYRAAVLLTDSGYSVKTGLQKVNASSVGIAVNTYDKMDERIHTVCPYDLREYDGDSLIFEYTVDRIPFDYIRYIIAQIDYPIFMHEGSRAFQKCYVERNNTMPAFYHHVKNHGIIDLSDGAVHHIRVVATDHEGNRSVLHTLLRYDPVSTAFRPRTGQYMMALSPDSDNVIKGDGFSAIIPGRYLLDSVYINYSSTPSTAPGVYSNVIKIGDSYDLLGYFSLSVRAVNLPDRLRDKAVVVWRNAAGGTAVRGGTWTGDMLTAQCREFGSFYIVIDTIPPRITPINIIRGKNMHLAKNIAVAISDNLSGIADYHGYIDGKWQLMELDGKTAVLRMALPHDLSAGEHKFKLVVTDDRKNSSEFTTTFIY
ncbi:unnamed protein product [Sphagnum jensenii]|uniref:M23ase beta-sheet core domain-containing protein n=1 Tax=Sphagnum jensenii TaxID=128206 RepID=A0ABP0ZY40_9BRYO